MSLARLFLSLTLPLEEGKERVFYDAKGVDVGQGGVGGGARISTYRREGKVVFEKEVVFVKGWWWCWAEVGKKSS